MRVLSQSFLFACFAGAVLTSQASASGDSTSTSDREGEVTKIRSTVRGIDELNQSLNEEAARLRSEASFINSHKTDPTYQARVKAYYEHQATYEHNLQQYRDRFQVLHSDYKDYQSILDQYRKDFDKYKGDDPRQRPTQSLINIPSSRVVNLGTRQVDLGQTSVSLPRVSGTNNAEDYGTKMLERNLENHEDERASLEKSILEGNYSR
jgi:hypothetical protein